MNKKIAYLDVLCWSAHDPFATHLMASLNWVDANGKRNKKEIFKTLTQKEADELNKQDDYCSYKEGDQTIRFTDYNELMSHVKKLWKKLVTNAKILVNGDGCNLSVREALDGPPETVKKINKLYQKSEILHERAKKVGYTQVIEKDLIEIDKEYEAILETI